MWILTDFSTVMYMEITLVVGFLVTFMAMPAVAPDIG
jgi:hypothetical protein